MKLTEAEWKIMNILWDNHPINTRSIMRHLDQDADWAYTTIKTMFARLVEKGAVRMTMRDKTSYYEPLITRREAQRTAFFSLLGVAFDGAFGPLMHFMADERAFSGKEKEEILRLFQEEQAKELAIINRDDEHNG
jgi:BlaI family transcriptional regulator, penicillinase repressor